jgi:hypothetical protein
LRNAQENFPGFWRYSGFKIVTDADGAAGIWTHCPVPNAPSASLGDSPGGGTLTFLEIL